MLASTSPQSLYPPLGHANILGIFSTYRHLCWRRPPCTVFILRRGTPTCSGFFRPVGAYVGVDLSVKPLSSVEARQHARDFSGLSAPMLALTSPQSFCPPSRHANILGIFSTYQHLCWRRPPRKAFILRLGTPTCSGFYWPAGVIVGVDLPAKLLSSVETRQHAQNFTGLPAPKNEKTCIRKASLSCC